MKMTAGLIVIILVLTSGNALVLDDVHVLAADWGFPGKIINASIQHLTFSVLPIVNVSRPVAIDYDHENHVLYWSDVFLRQIRRTNIRTGQDDIIRQFDENSALDGIALDISEHAVFYTDAGNDIIYRTDTDTLKTAEIIKDNLRAPRAIITYNEKRLLLWTDWGQPAAIEMSSYDGTGRKQLVSTGLGWPNGITLDRKNERVFWCDAKLSEIGSIRLDGTDRRLILSEPIARYFDIFYVDEVLFFTDWTRQRSIRHMPAGGGSVSSLRSTGFNHLAGIHVLLPKHLNQNVSCLKMPCVSPTTAISTPLVDLTTDSVPTQNVMVWKTPAITGDIDIRIGNSIDRTHHRSDQQFSHGKIALMALGGLACVAVVVMLAIYASRRHREKRLKQISTIDDHSSEAFSNNTYSILGLNTDDRTPIYLSPCPEETLLRGEDNLYADIAEITK